MEETAGKKPHTGRRGAGLLRAVLFLAFTALLTAALNFCFIPNSLARADLHRIATRTYDDIFIGSSHGHSDIDPLLVDGVTGRKSTNVCMPGEYPVDSYYILKLACDTGHKPQRVIYEWDPGYWMTEDMAGNNPDSFYLRFPAGTTKLFYFAEKIITMKWYYVLEPWSEYRNLYRNIPATVRIKRGADYAAYGTADLDTDVKQYRPEGFAYFADGTEWDSFGSVLRFDRTKVGGKPVRCFEKLVDFCRREGIELTVVELPVPQETYDAYADAYADAHSFFTETAARYGISFRDFNGLTEADLPRSVANYRDYDGHMCGKLAEQFSGIIGAYLRK